MSNLIINVDIQFLAPLQGISFSTLIITNDENIKLHLSIITIKLNLNWIRNTQSELTLVNRPLDEQLKGLLTHFQMSAQAISFNKVGPKGLFPCRITVKGIIIAPNYHPPFSRPLPALT